MSLTLPNFPGKTRTPQEQEALQAFKAIHFYHNDFIENTAKDEIFLPTEMTHFLYMAIVI